MSIPQRLTAFLHSAWLESKKVTWPSRDELRESTIVVVVATFIVMLYLFVVDRALSLVLDFIIK
jgi:preprotein translocase subunit SecE